MHKNPKVLYTIFMIFLLFLCFQNQVFAEEKIISGKLKIINSKVVSINNTSYYFSNNPPPIIFKDKLGEQLINDISLVPDNVFGEITLDQSGEIEKMIVSCQESVEQENSELIYNFNAPVYQYKISPSLKYLAYFSPEKQKLKIIELETKKIVWEAKCLNPFFDWHPALETLTIANLKDNSFNIYNLDLKTLEIIPYIVDNSRDYVYDLKWSLNGNYLAFIKITGLIDSHGYSELKIFDRNKNSILKQPIADVNYITWSPDNKIAYTKFIEDYLVSKTTILDISEQDNETNVEGNSGESIFFNNNLIYTTIDNFNQDICLFNLKNNNSQPIRNELRYIDSLAILNNQELVYSFGGLPQIKILDLVNSNYIILNGMFPEVINNTLFYIKNESNNFHLMKYNRHSKK